MRFAEFPLVDVGTEGRRALALVFDHGLLVLATDGVAAECAFQAVLTLRRRLGRDVTWLASLVLDVAHAFPAPGAGEPREHEFRAGTFEEDDWPHQLDGFGWVTPTAAEHRFGAAVPSPIGDRLIVDGPHAVHLVSGTATH